MRKRVGFIHSGSFFHLADLADPALRAWDLVDCYAPQVTAEQLAGLDSVFVAGRQHRALMQQMAPLLLDFFALPGKKAFIGGENQVGTWLPGVVEERRETNFWAWRTGEDTGRRNRNLDHPIWQFFTDEAFHWHVHGALFPAEGALPLVELEEDSPSPTGRPGCIIYFDQVSHPAQLLVTTMDPSYHHGAGFMPGASQLLYRALQWLAL